jgi:beta-mannosidase
MVGSNSDTRIPDTSRDLNEHEASWVGEQRWSYRCTFLAPPKKQGIRIALVFEGLDTFAKVRLNGIHILESENMFINHHVDVTAQVNFDSTNQLQIDFDSALSRGREIQKAHPEHTYNCRQGGIERLGVRKAQYHWGWDWGPKYMTAGPWRPIHLETYCSRIENLSIEYALDETGKSCQGIISARIDGHGKHQVRLSLRDSNGDLVFQTDSNVAADGLVQKSFSLQNPSLWYPHGYGSQPRYYLDCELIVHGIAVQVLAKKIGFRRAELIQEVDVYGKSFYFRVNGIDVFAGGSCWIPADNFIPRLSPEKYREWMKLMVESNQIMTR